MVEGAVVVAADVDGLVIVVVTAADDEDDGGTVKLKPLEEEDDAGTENNDPDVVEATVVGGTVDALVADTEANVGVGVATDAPNGKLRELAEELAAAPVLENNEGAGAACEVAKENPLVGADAGVVGAADALLGIENAEAEGADENNEGVVLPVVVLPDDGVKPNDGAEAVVAAGNENPTDGAVVAVVAGDEAAMLPKSGAAGVDPNKAEPVGGPNPGAGAEVAAVLDGAAALLRPKPNDGVGAAVVAVVAPDADEPNPKPVAGVEKRLGVDAAEEAAPNILGVVAAAGVAPKRPGVTAVEEVAPKRPGVVAVAEAAGAPKGLGLVVAEPNRLGVVAAAEAAGAPKRVEADDEVG